MVVRRWFFSTLVAVGLAAAVQAQARDLMVVGFGGGFQDNARKHLFQGYAKAAGVVVKDDVYNGEMAKIAAQVKARDVTWDVVMVEAPELVRGCEDGSFEKLDSTFFKNYPELRRIKAYRTRRVFAITGDLMERPGPRVVESVRELQALLH